MPTTDDGSELERKMCTWERLRKPQMLQQKESYSHMTLDSLIPCLSLGHPPGTWAQVKHKVPQPLEPVECPLTQVPKLHLPLNPRVVIFIWHPS